MTGRERLLATLRRQPTDRVPISAYELTRHGVFGWVDRELSYAGVLVAFDECAVELPLWGGYTPPDPVVPTDRESWQEGDYTVTRSTIHTAMGDLTSVTKETPSVRTTWTVEHLFKTDADIDRYLSIPLNLQPVDTSEFAVLDAAVGDRGLVLCDTGDAVGNIFYFFEFGDFMIAAMTEPERIRALCERSHQEVMHRLRGMLDAGCGPLYRIWGPECCTPPYLPPGAFREFVVPYVSEMIDLIHRYGCLARIHCHGRVREVLDLIVETGADAIDPVEPPPDGDITLAEVKARYGNELILFGNMELKYLEQETPAEIDARVKEMMDAAKAGGGYVLMPTAAPINIPLSPKTEANYLAYFQAGIKYGQY